MIDPAQLPQHFPALVIRAVDAVDAGLSCPWCRYPLYAIRDEDGEFVTSLEPLALDEPGSVPPTDGRGRPRGLIWGVPHLCRWLLVGFAAGQIKKPGKGGGHV